MKTHSIDLRLNAGYGVASVSEDADHIYAPVTILTEGVHAGNLGPVYYPVSLLERTAEDWSGTPITPGHPSKDGKSVSIAETPDKKIGVLVETRFCKATEDSPAAIRGTIILHKTTLKELSPEALHKLATGQLEVSTGGLSAGDGESGLWNDEEYTETITEFRPDHLALLPNAKGACSWTDGCGVRPHVNQKKGKNVKNLFDRLKQRATLQYTPPLSLVNTESYEQVREMLQDGVSKLNSTMIAHLVRAVYSDHFVYHKINKETGEDLGMFKRSYNVTDDGQAEIAETSVPVRQVTEYVEVANEAESIEAHDPFEDFVAFTEAANKCGCNTTNAESNPTPAGEESANVNEPVNNREEERMDRIKYVDGLIANERAPYTETDRESLEAMSDESLERVHNHFVEEPEAKTVEETVNEVVETVLESKPVTVESYLANADIPDAVREVLTESVSNNEAMKKRLIKRLVDNEACEFKPAELQTKSVNELRSLVKLAEGVNYSLAGGQGETEIELGTNEDKEAAAPPAPRAFDKVN